MLQCSKLLEGHTEELIFVDETPEIIAVSQGRLLHETNNLHPFQQDSGAEEKYDSEAEEEKYHDGFPTGMLRARDLSVVKVDVSGVLCASHFEGLIAKLEFLQIKAAINTCVSLKGHPHVIWRVYLIKIFVFELSHFLLNFLKFVKLGRTKDCRSLY